MPWVNLLGRRLGCQWVPAVVIGTLWVTFVLFAVWDFCARGFPIREVVDAIAWEVVSMLIPPDLLVPQ